MISEYDKMENDIKSELEKLENLLSMNDSQQKFEEMHSLAWTIQLKAERMLRKIE